MKKALSKLKSQRGVSLLMSLLLLIVAIVVSAVVVSAALSSAHVKKTTQESQQNYLTVSSAVDVFVQELRQMKYSASQTGYYAQYGEWKTDKYDKYGELGTEELKDDWTIWTFINYEKFSDNDSAQNKLWDGALVDADGNVFTDSDDLIFDTLLMTAMNEQRSDNYNFDLKSVNGSYNNVLTLEVDGVEKTVYLDFTMDKDFTITAKFYLLGSAGSPEYAMTVEAKPTQTGKVFGIGKSDGFLDTVNKSELTTIYSSWDAAEKSGLAEDVTPVTQQDAADYLKDKPSGTTLDSYGPDKTISGYYGAIERNLELEWTDITITKGGTT